MSFIPLYKNQPTFGEVDVGLRDMGLVPHNWFGMGNTSFYGEYGRAADYIRSGPANSAVAGFVNPVTNGFEAASSAA